MSLAVILTSSPQQWECLPPSCHHSLRMAPTLVNRCHRLGLAKALREILAALPLRVIRDPRQGYRAECIQID